MGDITQVYIKVHVPFLHISASSQSANICWLPALTLSIFENSSNHGSELQCLLKVKEDLS